MRLVLICALIGLIAGGIVGYFTKPDMAQIKLPGLELTVTENNISANDSSASAEEKHIMLYSLIGLAIGGGIGIAANSVTRKRK